MTNRKKAERCGEFVRDGLDAMADPLCDQHRGMTRAFWHQTRDLVVDGARQAGHWGRLALGRRDT